MSHDPVVVPIKLFLLLPSHILLPVVVMHMETLRSVVVF